MPNCDNGYNISVTNIPNDEGIRAASKLLTKNRSQPDVRLSNLNLVKIMETDLAKNHFLFNSDYHLQISVGTTMDRQTGLGLANCFMGNFEI